MTIGTLSIIVGVVLLIILKLVFKDEGSSAQDGGRHGTAHDELFKEEPETDPSWSVLPGNVWHSDED